MEQTCPECKTSNFEERVTCAECGMSLRSVEYPVLLIDETPVFDPVIVRICGVLLLLSVVLPLLGNWWLRYERGREEQLIASNASQLEVMYEPCQKRAFVAVRALENYTVTRVGTYASSYIWMDNQVFVLVGDLEVLHDAHTMESIGFECRVVEDEDGTFRISDVYLTRF